MYLMYLLSNISKRSGNCCVDCDGRRKDNSAPTSVTCSAPDTVSLTNEVTTPELQELPLTIVIWYPTPYLYNQ